MAKPIFVISLPRSGSTLLQRMLMSSPMVASAAEPWIMLPFWAMRDAHAGRSVYFHHTAANAINDFVGTIPDGEEVYTKAVGEFGRHMYSAAAGEKPFFLDKTPRYYLILPLLLQAFPEARFVVLTRHPLAMLSSVCNTFNKGRFRWFEYNIDWFEGHRCLANLVREARSNVRIIKYEDLTRNPEVALKDLCDWLQIEYKSTMVNSYQDVEFSGRMGDPTGVHQYAQVSNLSVNKWQSFFNSAYRRRAALRMLQKLDPMDISVLGYPLDTIKEELFALPPNRSLDVSSRIDGIVNRAAELIDFRYLQARKRARRDKLRYTYGYYRCS